MKNKSFWILLILIVVTGAMLASGTFAWLMDTERIDADFQAGVLDIELGQSAGLEFQNLRPLSLAQFEAEFGAAYENVNTEGFDPAPVYFRPVTVNNTGTLPARITISVVNQGAPSGCRVKTWSLTAGEELSKTARPLAETSWRTRSKSIYIK